ncbi:MAG: hypothetical protein BRC33_02855 [Cyanobacteria bacterium SW_9_44_58]|nr:MAG: hypothetical protein BRC33_02855 [Cyanobacteria bacterium SW_9_44_58]
MSESLSCPKHQGFYLEKSMLAGEIPTHCCPHCHGHWIDTQDYEDWQLRKSRQFCSPERVLDNLDLEREISTDDKKAGFCPECQCYLNRAKVPINTPFFVESCASCNGIWLDNGEWEILTQLGLELEIKKLFLRRWQAIFREKQKAQYEQEIIIEKLGSELAEKLFEIANLLENHDDKEVGIAYLINRLNQSRKTDPKINLMGFRKVHLNSYKL